MHYEIRALAAALTLSLITLGAAQSAHAAVCASPDARTTVFAGAVDSTVANRALTDGCSINDRVLDDPNTWGSKVQFLSHVSSVTLDLLKQRVINSTERTQILNAAKASDVGAQLKIKIIGFNDFHGNLESPGNQGSVPAGGVDYFAAHIDKLRAQNPLNAVVSAGDMIGASPLVSALFHDEPTIEAMNRIAIDFNAVGNHEFDDNRTELLRMQNGGCHPTDANSCQGNSVGTPVPFEGAKFKFLAANVIDTASGKTIFPAYGVKDFKGNKIAFIGMTLEGTPSIVTPSGVAGLSFNDEADTVNALIPSLKAQGIETIVVVLHEGNTTTSTDINSCSGVSGALLPIIARLDDEVDLVVSGHTHRAYNCVLPNLVGRNIPATSAGSFGRILTDIELTLDTATREVMAVTANNLVVDRTSVTPVASLTTLVSNYKTLSAPIANRVIGSVTASLTRTANAAGESSLGDIIADAQLEATQAPDFGGAVAAFMNPGGIRADITYTNAGTEGDGNVTYGEAFTTQPFGNSLVTMTLSGTQIDTLLEQQFTSCGQTSTRILQVSSGFSYTYDLAGGACTKVDLASIKLNGVAIDAATNYRITVNSFLADGGDNFLVLKEGTARLGGAQDLDALEAYFQAHSPVAPGPQNRITLQSAISPVLQ